LTTYNITANKLFQKQSTGGNGDSLYRGRGGGVVSQANSYCFPGSSDSNCCGKLATGEKCRNNHEDGSRAI